MCGSVRAGAWWAVPVLLLRACVVTLIDCNSERKLANPYERQLPALLRGIRAVVISLIPPPL